MSAAQWRAWRRRAIRQHAKWSATSAWPLASLSRPRLCIRFDSQWSRRVDSSPPHPQHCTFVQSCIHAAHSTFKGTGGATAATNIRTLHTARRGETSGRRCSPSDHHSAVGRCARCSGQWQQSCLPTRRRRAIRLPCSSCRRGGDRRRVPLRPAVDGRSGRPLLHADLRPLPQSHRSAAGQRLEGKNQKRAHHCKGQCRMRQRSDSTGRMHPPFESAPRIMRIVRLMRSTSACRIVIPHARPSVALYVCVCCRTSVRALNLAS